MFSFYVCIKIKTFGNFRMQNEDKRVSREEFLTKWVTPYKAQPVETRSFYAQHE